MGRKERGLRFKPNNHDLGIAAFMQTHHPRTSNTVETHPLICNLLPATALTTLRPYASSLCAVVVGFRPGCVV